MSETSWKAGDNGAEDADQLVPATTYIPESQYKNWKQEAAELDQSVSTYIATMVENGSNDISLEPDSPSEIEDLRRQLRRIRSERNALRDKVERHEQQRYQVGLGKIKDLIINNPGLKRQEIINHVAENPVIFVDKYLDELKESNFVRDGEEWYPPNEMEGEK